MKKPTQLTYFIFEVTKTAHRIVKATKDTGPVTRMKKSVLERDYIRNNSVAADCYALALRQDLAKCYITKIGSEIYLDEAMLNWYPPSQNGARPASFYARKPPGTHINIDRSSVATDLSALDTAPAISCPNCGTALDLKIKKN